MDAAGSLAADPTLEPPVPQWERPVFVLAPARSGSTILARLLNCMSGLTVWGEHAGIVRQMARSFEFLSAGKHWTWIERQRPWAGALATKQPTPPASRQAMMTMEWANPFALEDVIEAYKACLLRLFTVDLPADRRWGFKEIRYERPEYDFLKLLFPHAQFVLLTRDPALVVRSQFVNHAGSDPERLLPILDSLNSFQVFVKKLRRQGEGGWTYVDYSELVADPEGVARRLESFLGESLEPLAWGSLKAELPPRSPAGPYAEGGVEAVVTELGGLFRENGLHVPIRRVERCANLFRDLRVPPQPERSDRAPDGDPAAAGA